VAATGAIRRTPKYAVRVEMGQIWFAEIIASLYNASDMPAEGGFLKLNNSFGMFVTAMAGGKFRLS
jgi:hypothetical protein